MNTMTKGAIATGIGVALLLGGGGTLAWWSVDLPGGDPGSITAGDLNLKAGEASWTSNKTGHISNIEAYRIVPGEKITYSQDLTVTLEGKAMAATVSAEGIGRGEFGETAKQTPVQLTLDGERIVGPLKASMTDSETHTMEVKAATTFEFFASTGARDRVGAAYDFGEVAYKLEQIKPQAVAAP
ncbi:alternate-type signal peptide domain-containing protein [Arthrobacter sp. USHLN218]|uniref:alternate-type signal peptide domain-containing protein n=1 Tax=Arthrobacter sp. USHLN218 TaxID=3081232 RepID=UPI0030174FA7